MSQARKLGPQWRSSRWTAQERAILDRHMRDYLAGRFPSFRIRPARSGGEFEVQYRRVQHRKPWRERAPLCRNVKMILDKLRRDTLRLGRRPHGRFDAGRGANIQKVGRPVSRLRRFLVPACGRPADDVRTETPRVCANPRTLRVPLANSCGTGSWPGPRPGVTESEESGDTIRTLRVMGA